MNLYETRIVKPHSFLVGDTTIASDKHLLVRYNIFRKNIKPNHKN